MIMSLRTGISGLDVALITVSVIVIVLGAVFVSMAYMGMHHPNHTTTTTKATITSTTTATNSTTTTTSTTTKEVWGG
jgi:predicted S18 family serine protease